MRSTPAGGRRTATSGDKQPSNSGKFGSNISTGSSSSQASNPGLAAPSFSRWTLAQQQQQGLEMLQQASNYSRNCSHINTCRFKKQL